MLVLPMFNAKALNFEVSTQQKNRDGRDLKHLFHFLYIPKTTYHLSFSSPPTFTTCVCLDPQTLSYSLTFLDAFASSDLTRMPKDSELNSLTRSCVSVV